MAGKRGADQTGSGDGGKAKEKDDSMDVEGGRGESWAARVREPEARGVRFTTVGKDEKGKKGEG